MLIDDLRSVYLANKQAPAGYLRNLLKERLQFYVLQFVSISSWSSQLIFKGGTCLRFFYDLHRLSEDLDFDITPNTNFSLPDFTKAITKHFTSTLKYDGLTSKIAANGRTIYLKFALLDQIGPKLSPSASNILFIRLDFAPALGHSFTTQLSTKSTLNFSFIIKHYALPDLMAGKIAAILKRETIEGTTKMPRVKGRDYYDLIWYLEKRTAPNWIYLQEIIGLTKSSALAKLKSKFVHLDPKVLKTDLTPFFPDPRFVDSFSQNIHALFKTHLDKLIL
jgi:predicted nucleotidyltransferase component of viral defense system